MCFLENASRGKKQYRMKKPKNILGKPSQVNLIIKYFILRYANGIQFCCRVYDHDKYINAVLVKPFS